jgi:Ras association domain-containing protein 2/4
VAASDNDTTISESLSYDSSSISSNSLDSGSSKESSPIHGSNTLPSKLDIKKIEWDEIDDLLQVERKDDNNHHYATLPSPMTSSMTDSQISNISTDESSYKTLSPDGETTSQSSSVYFTQMDDSKGCSSSDDTSTLKPCDFEDFKRQMSQEFVNGANDMPSVQDGTLKVNQKIDPSRINDSLKLYQDNIMNRSVQSEDGLSGLYSLSNSFCIPGQINSFNIQDTLNLLKNSSSSSSDDKTLKQDISKVLKKSSSMSTSTTGGEDDGDSSWSSDKKILRSKSGPDYATNDFESETVKKSGRPAKSIHIKMDCYDELKSPANGGSSTTPYDDEGSELVVLRKKQKGSVAIKRRSGNRR